MRIQIVTAWCKKGKRLPLRHITYAIIDADMEERM